MDLPPIEPSDAIPTFKEFLALPKPTPLSPVTVLSVLLFCVTVAVIYVFIANWVSIKRISVRSGLSSTGGKYPTISNTGVLSVAEGTGITLSGSAQEPIISNAGVLSVDAGTGCTNGGTAQNRVINCGALEGTTVTAITVNGANSTTGTVNLVNGTNTTISASGQDITITTTVPSPVLASGIFVCTGTATESIPITGMTSSGIVNLTYVCGSGNNNFFTAVTPGTNAVSVSVSPNSTTSDKIIWSVAKLS